MPDLHAALPDSHHRELADAVMALENPNIAARIAEYAGAPVNRVLAMLPKQADWRWMMSGERNPWYPTTRLFRQQVLGDWSPVVEALRGALEAL